MWDVEAGASFPVWALTGKPALNPLKEADKHKLKQTGAENSNQSLV